MIRSIVSRIAYRMADLKPESKKISQMAQKIEAMNQTMNKTSPKLFSILVMLSTAPTFYFGYKMITSQYADESFKVSASAGLVYINIKNTIFFFCLTTLNKLKYNSPTSKHALPKIGVFGRLLPPLLALISCCLPSSDNKFSVVPTLITDLTMLAIEAQMANFGIYPFWLYSYRHFIRFFDWIIIIATYSALKNMEKRIKQHSHEFTIIKKEKSIKQTKEKLEK